MLETLNLRGGRALIERTWTSYLQYRSFFFLLAFGWMIPPLVYLFVWSAAAGGATAGGLERGELVAYYLALILVNQFTYSTSNWTVGDVIREGQLNTWLLRPLPPLYEALAADLAGKAVFMAFVGPAVGLLALLLHPELHVRAEQAGLFLPALGIAAALRFFWGLWLALLAFWATRANALLAVQDTLVFLIGGQVAPVDMLPAGLRGLATILPFRYMVGFPVEVLTGQAAWSELAAGFTTGLGWLAFAILLTALAWRYGLRRYSAVGG